jgi:hypothetical protein
MIRIRNAGIYRTDGSTLRLIKVTFALYAFVKINDVDGIASRNCLNRTFGLAQPTSSAFIINFVCHVASLFTPMSIAIMLALSRAYSGREYNIYVLVFSTYLA